MLTRIVFALISFFGLLIFRRMYPAIEITSIYVLFLYINLIYDFFGRLGKDIPIKQLTLLIAITQWAVAPILSYHFYKKSEFYSMQIPEDMYMSYIFPAIATLILGLFLPLFGRHSISMKKASQFFNKERETIIRRGKILFVIGLSAQILQPLGPKVLFFALFLIGKLAFVGVFYLYASNVKYKYLYVLGVFIPLVIIAANESIFHDMFLWGGFLFIIYSFIKQIGALRKAIIVVVAVIVFLFVQLIKTDYRVGIQFGDNRDRSEILQQVAADKIGSDLDEDYFQGLVDRLNQGWIIARIMYVVPTYEPFAEGETIIEGIKSSFIPRFIMPKDFVSGGYYFYKFTGYDLKDTSMNLGLVGEAYANYGLGGGVFFMFLFGAFVNLVLSLIYHYGRRKPEMVLWIPFLFMYMIKAEDDFTTMINQFTKSVYIMIGLFYAMKKLYPFGKVELKQN